MAVAAAPVLLIPVLVILIPFALLPLLVIVLALDAVYGPKAHRRAAAVTVLDRLLVSRRGGAHP